MGEASETFMEIHTPSTRIFAAVKFSLDNFPVSFGLARIGDSSLADLSERTDLSGCLFSFAEFDHIEDTEIASESDAIDGGYNRIPRLFL
jgi:hypothetical protein